MAVEQRAIDNQKAFYDNRFTAGYMDGFEYDVYERCRLYTVKQILEELPAPSAILDYGCGQGRYLAELHKSFPHATLTGCDVSDVGLRLAQAQNPTARFIPMADEKTDLPSTAFDLVISIEVLEHVRDVKTSVCEIVRVLKSQGFALITTPCANRFSLEWIRNALTGGLQPSHDGYGRFASDEPAHLRRLTSHTMTELFARAGADLEVIRFRAHFFTELVMWLPLIKRLPMAQRAKIALLDWHLFRWLPNGATMIALYRKR
jgi:ubiquinone/menaquinone biosynthesis C-methylase UbiE